jgi:hypothetical protein
MQLRVLPLGPGFYFDFCFDFYFDFGIWRGEVRCRVELCL